MTSNSTQPFGRGVEQTQLVGPQPAADIPPPTSPEQVSLFRTASIANGYTLIAALSGQKRPAGKNWQHGHNEARLIPPRAGELNTGVLATELQVIDIDVDDPVLVGRIREEAERQLGITIVRARFGSPRVALVYRTLGESTKRSVQGEDCKTEVLGSGQQFIAHGQHPDGSHYYWEDNRGPHSIARDQLVLVTEDMVSTFLGAVALIIGVLPQGTPRRHNASTETLIGRPSVVWDSVVGLPNMAAAACNGVFWFASLSSQRQNDFLRELMALPGMVALSNAPRATWLRLLFGLAEAEALGATDARAIALDWSQHGTTFDAKDFTIAWNSFNPDFA